MTHKIKYFRFYFIFFLFLFTITSLAQDRAAWMPKAKWGVMNHYLADLRARVDKTEMNVERWNKLIDNFDVEGLAEQLKSVGAGYYIISIGQNSGYYLSPNVIYDKLIGIKPSKCSHRDLIADLYDALDKRGIKLMVYLPSGAPDKDSLAINALKWKNGPFKNREFQLKWEQVIKEWSLRWGKKVSGWWFDGCFWPNIMYRSPEPPNFDSFAAAARAGNPNSALAFSSGLIPRVVSATPNEDYTAGEIIQWDRMQISRAIDGKIDGARIHILSFLGETWGSGSPRFKNEEIINSSKKVVSQGGAVTWDVPIQSNGLLSQEYIGQLSALGKAMGGN